MTSSELAYPGYYSQNMQQNILQFSPIYYDSLTNYMLGQHSHSHEGIDQQIDKNMNLTKNKIKTSLCKKWNQLGYCPYGQKCQFAHGISQLRCNVDQMAYKTKPCNSFFKKSYCPYGDRCNFSHQVHKFSHLLSNSNDGKQTQILQQQVKFVGYQEVLKQGKFAIQGKSILMGYLGHTIDYQNDNKSIGSTQDSKSQYLSRSILYTNTNTTVGNNNVQNCGFEKYFNFSIQDIEMEAQVQKQNQKMETVFEGHKQENIHERGSQAIDNSAEGQHMLINIDQFY